MLAPHRPYADCRRPIVSPTLYYCTENERARSTPPRKTTTSARVRLLRSLRGPRRPEKERMMISSTREIQDLRAIQLPLPANDRGTSVFAALQQRKTTREISATPLPIQLLSNLLWAACGVNRNTGPFGVPGRTAASASNSRRRSTSLSPSRRAPICTTHSTTYWRPSSHAICASPL